MQTEAFTPPQSPSREGMLHPEPTTPRHQGIPDPLLNPPGAPRKPRNQYSWSRKPREDTTFLRGYFQDLPADDAPTFGYTRRALERQFDEAWKQHNWRNKRDLDLVPRLGADVLRSDDDEAESAQPACFSCGSTQCPAALLPSEPALDFSPRKFASAPPPQLRSHLEDDDSSSCSGGELETKDFGGHRRKRQRSMSQQCLRQMLCLGRGMASPPLQPGTPCKQRWLNAPPALPTPHSP